MAVEPAAHMAAALTLGAAAVLAGTGALCMRADGGNQALTPVADDKTLRLWHELDSNGIVIIDDVYSPDQLAAFRSHYDELFAQVQAKMDKLDSKTQTYLNVWNKEVTLDKVQIYHLEDDSEIIKIADGRYDFTTGMETGSFAESAFHEPPVLARLMRFALRDNYSHYAGALPSKSKSVHGPWHRDTYDMFGDDTIDVTLPPFYYTVLIPLVECTLETGATEFVVGSHKQPAAQCSECQHFPAVCRPGSIVVFDGRTCHRGLPNTSSAERPVLYMVRYAIFPCYQTCRSCLWI
jgi:ectoine hydroxylase-related dioxygenase (phytanoyl-CoA dioxygenase family)